MYILAKFCSVTYYIEELYVCFNSSLPNNCKLQKFNLAKNNLTYAKHYYLSNAYTYIYKHVYTHNEIITY